MNSSRYLSSDWTGNPHLSTRPPPIPTLCHRNLSISIGSFNWNQFASVRVVCYRLFAILFSILFHFIWFDFIFQLFLECRCGFHLSAPIGDFDWNQSEGFQWLAFVAALGFADALHILFNGRNPIFDINLSFRFIVVQVLPASEPELLLMPVAGWYWNRSIVFEWNWMKLSFSFHFNRRFLRLSQTAHRLAVLCYFSLFGWFHSLFQCRPC